MGKIRLLLLLLLTGSGFIARSQSKAIDSIKFFTDESIVDLSITTNIRELQDVKGDEVYQPADVTMRFPDSSVVSEQIRIAARGHFRRETCVIPPLLLNFHNTTSPLLSKLGKLKLVIGCGVTSADEQLILKEYLAYRIYNLITPKSFRVRLVRVNYNDTRGKLRPFSQYAFFLEDDNDMAERNGCEKKDKASFLTESTDRETMTMVAVFEYMISNGDWSVPNNHNTKLIFQKHEQTVPYVVPYDFDHSGFVNAGYALPSEILGTETVTERVYRGFPRTMEELQVVLDIFRKNKDAVMNMINNFTLLASRTRKEAVSYLNEFYSTINNKRDVQTIFIDNARDK